MVNRPRHAPDPGPEDAGAGSAGGRLVFAADAVDLHQLERIGRWFARIVRGGELILLEGPLGAGKTALVRAIARGLEVTDPVRSPSFTIANVYRGRRLTVNHLDLYRLELILDEDVLALEDYVAPDAVTLVEWPEAGLERLGEADYAVKLEHQTVDTRRLEVIAGTAEAAARWDSAEEAEA